MASNKTAFITVGTTEFTDLTKIATSIEFLKVLQEKGYSEVIIQKGRSEVGDIPTLQKFTVECYDYKPSLKEDMEKASLIISHGGSGSILESLELQKPLIVVINPTLMNNHQTELASQLAKESYLTYTTPEYLLKTVEEFNVDLLKLYKTGYPSIFGNFLNKTMGFTTS